MVASVRANRVAGMAAEVAFWSVLSMVPAVLVLASLLGSLEPLIGAAKVADAERRVVDALGGVFATQGNELADSVGNLFANPQPGLFSVALVLALWTASRVFASMANAFAVVYNRVDHRPWLLRRALGLALGGGSLVVFAGLLVALVAGPLAGDQLGSAAVAAVAVVAWVTTLYRWGPGRSGRWIDGVPGALLAMVVAVVFTFGFRLYLDVQGSNVIVAALGGLLVALLWFYLLALGLLLGAVFNAVVSGGGSAVGDHGGVAYHEVHDRH